MFRRPVIVLTAALTTVLLLAPVAAAAPTVEAPGYSWETTPGGTRYVSPAGTFVVTAPFDSVHRSHGGGRGALGYPVRERVVRETGAESQVFERGELHLVQGVVHVVLPPVAALVREHPGLGAATSAFVPVAGDTTLGRGVQTFENGAVHVTETGVVVVPGIAVPTTGAEELGLALGPWRAQPGTGENPDPARGYQLYENGVVYSTSSGAVAVIGDLDRAHRATGGGTGSLGYPVASAREEDEGRGYQVFETGVVYFSAATTLAVPDPVSASHRRLGGGSGSLGYPVAPLRMQSASFGYQIFEKGVVYTSPRGTWPVLAPVDPVHRAQGGGGGVLGYPVAPIVTQAGPFRYQVFERGVVYSSGRGTHAVTGDVDVAHRDLGGGGGRLGYPIGAQTLRGIGGICQAFERGFLHRSTTPDAVWRTSATTTYFVAPALLTLRTQVDLAHPTRSKASDGTIGDAAHQTRVSDHNPDVGACGVVRAMDIDQNLRTGDPQALADALITDPRVAYLIFRGRIWSNPEVHPRQAGWRPYTGSNPHNTHLHVSLRHGTGWDHAVGPWPLP